MFISCNASHGIANVKCITVLFSFFGNKELELLIDNWIFEANTPRNWGCESGGNDNNKPPLQKYIYNKANVIYWIIYIKILMFILMLIF